MKQLVLFLFGFLLMSSCDKHKYFDGPNQYTDDFEFFDSSEQLIQPIPEQDYFWSFEQITVDGNLRALDSTFAHTGQQSLRFYAKKSDQTVSKASISKQNMSFWEGENVRMTCWYYLPGTDSLNWLFIADLEEQVAVGAGPGMRLAIVNNQIRVEHKFNEKDLIQDTITAVDFPRNEWVEVVWEVGLSTKDEGTVKVYQNGQLIIDAKNRKTLPTDLLYFQQGTKGMYSSIEIGATANSTDYDVMMWADDFKIEKF
jgi:hypothetical protein